MRSKTFSFQVRNPKHEIRNKPEIRILKFPKLNVFQSLSQSMLGLTGCCFEFRIFVIRVCFGFRYSDLFEEFANLK
jgi:hypothetical protein